MKTSKKPARKNLVDVLNHATIEQTGKTADGRHMANVVFPDGTRGALDYELLRTHMVSQGKTNRSLLESLGYKVGMVCVAGLHGSADYEKAGKPTLRISGTHMNRIIELGENGAIRELTVKELLVMWGVK